MSSSKPLPLQERVSPPLAMRRLSDLLILLLLLALLAYRLASFRAANVLGIRLIAFLCESWFAFVWFLNVNAAWSPVSYRTYPERVSNRLKDMPAVDLFVTTADPTLEPPVVTINTVLSLLAAEYPAHRLACYVSDDGGSPLTFYALQEASKFAKLWVPFCKRYCVRVRAPFMYFSTELQSPATLTPEFVQDWKHIKGEYIELTRKIEGAAKNGLHQHLNDELGDFSGIERGNHPSIIKVISENKGEDGVPHLIYVAREKRPKSPHHYKAGAMNVLTRVSGVMTSAPFILNVDCNMFANNPEVVLHGMCLLFGFESEAFSGYVQAPQLFYGALDDDPFGNQLVFLIKKYGDGIGGIQGPIYSGTNCFHRRKIIYGSSPDQSDELSYEQLRRTFGSSVELMESAEETASIMRGDICSRVPAANLVAACSYEFNTLWGKEIGWIYGSATEDVLTGLRIHAKGWRSVNFSPDPPAFLGTAPTGGAASLTQYKRWSTGLLEILFGPNSPILATVYKQLSFRQCLAYLLINVWALSAVVEFCYALLPAYCVVANASFLPNAYSPEFLIPAALFTVYNAATLAEYLQYGLSARAWWNNQRMSRITSSSSFLFGFLCVLLKMTGLSETVFEVTRKDQSGPSEGTDDDPGRFTFDASPLFVPPTAVMLVHVAALVTGAVHAVRGREGRWGTGEVVCCAWMVSSFWPFVRGLFGKGKYGIPWAVVWKAVVLGSVFSHLCGFGRAN